MRSRLCPYAHAEGDANQCLTQKYYFFSDPLHAACGRAPESVFHVPRILRLIAQIPLQKIYSTEYRSPCVAAVYHRLIGEHNKKARSVKLHCNKFVLARPVGCLTNQSNPGRVFLSAPRIMGRTQ